MQASHELNAQEREILSFQIFYSQKNIRATWVLALIIVFIFLLEEYFGGSTNIVVLVSMGANVGSLVKDGQYYRLLSSVFLHSGYLHVFCNTYVLFALGGFFNRIFNLGQYLLLFFVSGLAGSLSSVFIGQSSVSVGASGAIWGFFGASVALAMFKNPLIPEAFRLRLRRITIINLAINLGVSFLPMVDIWAHLGGGVAGFVLSLWFIYSHQNILANKLKAALIKTSAVIFALAYALAIILGVITARAI